MTTPDLLRKVAEAVFAACRGDAGAPGFPKRVDLDAIVARVQAEHAEVLDAPDSDGPWMARRNGKWVPVLVEGFIDRCNCDEPCRWVMEPGREEGFDPSDFDRWQRIVPPAEPKEQR